MWMFRPECSDGIETLTPLDQERLDRGINNTLAALVPTLKDIHQVLIEPPKVGETFTHSIQAM